MPDDIPFPSGFEALREPMRKLDALLAIARRVQLESGKVPPGLMEDFHEVRKQLEKAFVFNFRGVDERLQGGLRKFLKNTRDANAEQLDKNLERLCRVSHSMLNALMIQGAPTLSLEDDLAGNAQQEPPLRQAQGQEAPARGAVDGPLRQAQDGPLRQAEDGPVRQAQGVHSSIAPAQAATSASASVRRGHGLFVALAIALVALLTVVIGWATGLFDPSPANNAPVVAANNPPRNAPAENTPPPVDTSTPFDAAASGYPSQLALYPLDTSIDPRSADPGTLLPDELPGVLLGLEDNIYLLEPARLKTPPEQTRGAMRAFARDVMDSQPAWKESRKAFLDAFVAHAGKRLNLRMYEDARGTVLVSDVLFHAGGGQQSLCAALAALALSARCPIGLYAPNGVARPVIGIVMRDGLHTYNGEAHGLRGGTVPLARVAELVTEMCQRLLPTLTEPGARLYCLAVIRNLSAALSVEQARIALADIQLDWMTEPAPDAAPETLLRHQLSVQLQPVVCNALLYDHAGADAAEALALYRLASAAGDEAAIKQAILLLGKRAEKGAMLDGLPLALRVGDLLRDHKKTTDAAAWYRRALEDHPDDARAALRLADLLPGAKLDYLREAYARGERGTRAVLELAAALSAGGDDLAALALLDQLCETDARATHVEAAVLTCLALERPDWAQARIARYADVADSPALQRLDLICELQRNGLSDRARVLAKAMRDKAPPDPFVEGLLRKYGG